MLCTKEWNNKYRKGDENVRNVDTVNKYLDDVSLAALKTTDEVATFSENVEIHDPKE